MAAILVIFAIVFLLCLAAGIFLFAFSLHCVLSTRHIPKANYKRSLKISAILMAINFFMVLLSIVFLFLAGIPANDATKTCYFLFMLAIYGCAFHFLMKRYHGTGFWKNVVIFALTQTVYGIISVLAAFLIIVPIRMFVFQPFVVQGNSMSPNLNEGSYLFVNEMDRKYQRGDVVVFEHPKDTSKRFIKRIIGLPGETISIEDGRVYINGQVLNETKYLSPSITTPRGGAPLVLKDDEFFILGDNRQASTGSQDFGPVSKNLIVGKILDVW